MPSWRGQTAALTFASIFDTLINTKYYICVMVIVETYGRGADFVLHMACGALSIFRQSEVATVAWQKISSHVQKLGGRVEGGT